MSKSDQHHPIQFDKDGKRVEFDKDGNPKTEPANVGDQPASTGDEAPESVPQRLQDEVPGGDLKNQELHEEPKPEANPAKGNQKPR